MSHTLLNPWALAHFISSFGTPQKFVYDKRLSFMSTGFSTYFLEHGITHAPGTKWSLWTNGKIEIQNKHLRRPFRSYLLEAGKNWANLPYKFAFPHNTSMNSTTGTTAYETVFGFKPQIPISLKLGLVGMTTISISLYFVSFTKPFSYEQR